MYQIIRIDVVKRSVIFMIDRIRRNEERLNNALVSIKNLENALNSFKSNKKDIDNLNKYYGSNKWFQDKESFEQGKITNIKCGVLSEDSVWNMNEEISDLIEEMDSLVKIYKH